MAFCVGCGGGEDPDSGAPPASDSGTPIDTGTPDGTTSDSGVDGGFDLDGAILNQAPVVSIAPVPDVTLPAGATLDGTVTDDGLPAGSNLTIGWVMFSGPGLVTFANPTNADTAVTFSVSGDYMLGLTANDGAIMSSATVVVHVLDPGLPSSVVGQIGPRSVDVGSTLTLDLEKASVSGEVVFGATPFPLPANMSLVRTSGLFKFTPTLDQVGTIDVTFTAQDNSGTDRETVTITVVGPTPGAPTAISGRVLDANDAANGIITPLEGVTIRSLDQARSVTSGATGYFTLSGLPAGENYLEFDGSTVPGQRIAGYRARYNLPETVNTVIERPIYLMHIETAFEVPVIPSLTTVINNTRIGVSLVIPPFTAKADDGSDFTGMVSISEVPAMFTPGAGPPDLQPGMVVTLQPMGITFINPAPVTFPNLDNLPAGTLMQTWSLNHQTGRFFIAGTASVSADGNSVGSMSGGLREASWHFMLPPRPTSQPPLRAASQSECVPCRFKAQRSSVSPHDGSFHTEHRFASGSALGDDLGLVLDFDSRRACVKPLAQGTVQIPERSAVPMRQVSSVEVGGVELGRRVYTDTSGLNEEEDNNLRHAFRIDAAELPTGDYDFTMTTTNLFGAQGVSAVQSGKVIVNNGLDSPFGAGWSLAGLSQIYPNPSSTLLVEGSGSALRFDAPARYATGLSNHRSVIPTPMSSGGYHHMVRTGDFDGDTRDDVLVFAGGTGTREMVVYQQDAGTLTELSRTTIEGTYLFGPLVIADLNNDLALDVVYNWGGTAIGGLGRFSVRYGLGDGRFREPLVIMTPSYVNDLEVGDLNNDGQPDVVASLTNRDPLVFLGQPNGESFVELPLPRPVGSNFELTDVDGDQRLDVVAIGGNLIINWFKGNGDGTFAAAAELQRFTRSILDLTVADLDKNGFEDLITVTAGGTNNGIEVSMCTRSACLSPELIVPLAGLAEVDGRNLTIEDLDNDGFLDIAMARSSPPQVNIALNNGTGKFTIDRFQAFPITTAVGAAAPAEVSFFANGLPNSLSIATTHRIGGSLELSIDDVTITADPVLRPPPGEQSQLTLNPDGSFTRVLDWTTTHYDPAGHQIMRVDDRGGVTNYSWNANGELASITDHRGRTYSFNYGPTGYNLVDPQGRVTTVELDAENNLVGITDPDGERRAFSYGPDHTLIQETSKNGDTTTHTYDANCQLTGLGHYGPTVTSITPGTAPLGLNLDPAVGTELNPLSPVLDEPLTATWGGAFDTTLRFDDLNLPISITTDGSQVEINRDGEGRPIRDVNALGVTTLQTWSEAGELESLAQAWATPDLREISLDYDIDGRPIQLNVDGADFDIGYDGNSNRITQYDDALGRSHSATYDAQSRLQTVVDEVGGVTTIGYDVDDRPISFTAPTDLITVLTWTDADNVASITHAPGTPAEDRIEFTYDAMNRTTSVIDSLGTTQYAYDANGNPTVTTFPDGRTVTRTYDAADQVTSIADSSAGMTMLAYDPDGNLITELDPYGQMTSYEYDALGNVVATTTGRGRDVYVRDAGGRLTQVTDPLGFETTFTYDALGRVTSRADLLGRFRAYTYDAQDRLLTLRNERNQTITNTYDASGRLTGRSGPGLTETMGYDEAGRLLFAQDGDSRFELTYDLAGRILTQRTVDLGSQTAVTLTNTYDQAGNRIGLSDSFGGAITYGYGSAGELTDITTANGTVIGRTFVNGRLSSESCGDRTTNYTYGAALGPDEIELVNGAATTLERLTYVRDAAGRPTSLTNFAGNVQSFTYDGANRLIGAGSAASPESYTWDSSNRRTSSHRSATYTYETLGRIASDATYTYTFDMTRNRTQRRTTVGGATFNYTYDAQNQLTGVAGPGLNVAYRYDVLGRLIEKRNAGATVRRYVWDGFNLLMSFTPTNTVEARYIHGDELDRPFALEIGANLYCYHQDALGSVYGISDATGTLVNRYAYDAFGNFTTMVEGVTPNAFTFTGREWHADVGLHSMRTRWYDPNLGLFLQADSFGFLGGDVHEFGYAGNNPMVASDPWGRGGPEPDPRITPRDMRSAVLQQVYRGAQESGLNIVGKTAVEVIEQDGLPPRMVLTVRLDESGQPLPRLEDAKRLGNSKVAASTLVIEVNAAWGLDGYYWNSNARVVDNRNGRYSGAAGCGPTKEEWRRARDGRPDFVAFNDPDTRDFVNNLYPTEVNESIRTTLGRLRSQDRAVRHPAPAQRWSANQPQRSRGR